MAPQGRSDSELPIGVFLALRRSRSRHAIDRGAEENGAVGALDENLDGLGACAGNDAVVLVTWVSRTASRASLPFCDKGNRFAVTEGLVDEVYDQP